MENKITSTIIMGYNLRTNEVMKALKMNVFDQTEIEIKLSMDVMIDPSEYPEGSKIPGRIICGKVIGPTCKLVDVPSLANDIIQWRVILDDKDIYYIPDPGIYSVNQLW
jgi:hypothetical protein